MDVSKNCVNEGVPLFHTYMYANSIIHRLLIFCVINVYFLILLITVNHRNIYLSSVGCNEVSLLDCQGIRKNV
jgi:hypothetical protein